MDLKITTLNRNDLLQLLLPTKLEAVSRRLHDQ